MTPRARRMEGGDSAPRARLRLTGAGGWGILTCLAIAAAAANTANNLLYLLLSLLLAAYPVSAWMSRRSLIGLRGELAAPQDFRRGQPATVVVSLTAGGHGAAGVVLEVHASEAGVRRAPEPVSSLVSALPRGARTSVAVSSLLRRRGPARLLLVARSPFPFGVVEGVRRLAHEDVLVLPQPDPSWRVAVPQSVAEGEATARRGDGAEILNIRDHVRGDDARRIDWKATARLGRPMVREFALERQRRAVLVVDPGPAAGTPSPAADAELERAIDLAAGAAEDLSRDGWQLRLIAPGADASGDGLAVLRALALLPPAGAGFESPGGEWWSSRVAPGDTVLVFGAWPRAAAADRERAS